MQTSISGSLIIMACSVIAISAIRQKRALDALEGNFGFKKRALNSLDGEGFGFEKRALNSLEGQGFGFEKRSHNILDGNAIIVLRKRALDELDGSGFGLGFRKFALDTIDGSGFGFEKRALNSLDGEGFGFEKRALNSLDGEGFGFEKRALNSLDGEGFGFEKRALNTLEGSGFGFEKRSIPGRLFRMRQLKKLQDSADRARSILAARHAATVSAVDLQMISFTHGSRMHRHFAGYTTNKNKSSNDNFRNFATHP